MPRNICLDASSGVSPPETPSVPRAPQRYRPRVAFVLGKVLVVGLIFGLLIPGCATCAPQPQGSISSKHASGRSFSTPVSQGKATPTLVPTTYSTPMSSPIPIPTPPPYGTLYIKEWLAQYISAILAGKGDPLVMLEKFRQAYNRLSPDIRANLSFEVFKTDQEYTLPDDGCWLPGIAHVSHPDAQMWDVGVEMTNFECNNYGRPNYYSLWRFRIQWQQGQLWISSIGLYPTAVGEQGR